MEDSALKILSYASSALPQFPSCSYILMWERVDSGAYFCLKALKEKDIVTFEQSLRRSRLSMVAEFSVATLESTKRVIPALSKLRFFNDIQKAWKVQWPSGEEERRASVREEEKEWKRVILLKGRFEEVERLVALRGTLLRLLVDNSKQETSSALLLSPYLIYIYSGTVFLWELQSWK